MTSKNNPHYAERHLSPSEALAELQRQLRTTTFGHPPSSCWLDAVDSTNQIAHDLALAGAPEGTLVVAEMQHAGRGRSGRQWVAPVGSSILASLVLRPPPGITPGLLPFVAAVALAETLKNELGLWLELKWPNDFFLAQAKCGGILAESEWVGSKVAFVVTGLGLNVNLTTEDLAPLGIEATSLAQVAGTPIARLDLLVPFLAAWEQQYHALLAGQSPLPAWRKHASLLGQPITVFPATGPSWPATAVDVTDDGALIVQSLEGLETVIHAADVSIRAHPDSTLGGSG